MSAKEQLAEATRLARMRNGQAVGQLVTIPSAGVQIALVPLTEAEVLKGMNFMQSIEVQAADVRADLYVQRLSVCHDVWLACREPDDLTKLVWESMDAMNEDLDTNDIDTLVLELQKLMTYASPMLTMMSDEELIELKKVCGSLSWRELTGSQAAAATIFISTLWPDLRQVNSPGFTSIDSLTMTNGNDVSTEPV